MWIRQAPNRCYLKRATRCCSFVLQRLTHKINLAQHCTLLTTKMFFFCDSLTNMLAQWTIKMNWVNWSHRFINQVNRHSVPWRHERVFTIWISAIVYIKTKKLPRHFDSNRKDRIPYHHLHSQILPFSLPSSVQQLMQLGQQQLGQQQQQICLDLWWIPWWWLLLWIQHRS